MTAVSTQIATLFGVGRAPLVPGTLASAAALPLGWWIGVVAGATGLVVAATGVAFLGVWAAGRYATAAGKIDPPECVIDEVAGQWFALVPLALTGRLFHLLSLALAFGIFRALDIFKPWPIYKLQKYSGGLGIMLDDVAAGIAAGALVAGAALLKAI